MGTAPGMGSGELQATGGCTLSMLSQGWESRELLQSAGLSLSLFGIWISIYFKSIFILILFNLVKFSL